MKPTGTDTNFFETLAGLNAQGGWKINIAADKDGKLVVSVLLFNEKVGDDTRRMIPPMIFKGTPQEIDKGFFEAIAAPVQKTSQLFSNMEQYMKALDESKKQAKPETDKKGKDKKTENSKVVTFETEMAKVEELQAQEKYTEALMHLPSAEKYPDEADEIEEKRNELWELKDKKENNLFK